MELESVTPGLYPCCPNAVRVTSTLGALICLESQNEHGEQTFVNWELDG